MAKAKKGGRVAVITKNPDSVKFAHAPVYNLANLRKEALALIVKASNDPKKVAAIEETLECLKEFLDVRAEHAADVRTKAVAAEKARRESEAVAAAQAKVQDAKNNLKAAEEGAAKWKEVLATLTK